MLKYFGVMPFRATFHMLAYDSIFFLVDSWKNSPGSTGSNNTTGRKQAQTPAAICNSVSHGEVQFTGQSSHGSSHYM